MSDAHSVNSSKKIVWVGNNPNNSSNIHNITKVVYCDHNRTNHLIWPCTARLTDVYLVKLSTGGQNSDVSYSYAVDSQTLQPNVLMMPETVYSIKGTIEVYKDGSLQNRIKDCYFFPETISTNLDYPAQVPFTSITGNEAYSYGGRIATEIDANGNSTGTTYSIDYGQYTKWSSDSNPAHTGRMELQLGWWQPGVGYVQNGYIFDQNYTSRLILKRADVQSTFILFDHATSTDGSHNISDGYNLILNSPVTIWPKTRLHALDVNSNQSWQRYEMRSVSNVVYDSSVFTVVANNDGSYTITAISYGNNTTIEFDEESVDFSVMPDTTYSLYYGNHLYAQNISSLTTAKSYYILARDWNASQNEYGQEYSYTGASSMTSSDSTIVSCSGLTITPNLNKPGQTATITTTVAGQTISSFTVTVGTVSTVHYHVSDVEEDYQNLEFSQAHGPFQLTNSSSETINAYSVRTGQEGVFAIKFAVDQSMYNPATVYVTRDGELTSTNGNVDLYVSDGDSTVYLTYDKEGAGAQEFTVEIPIYSDYNCENQLGKLTITIYP